MDRGRQALREMIEQPERWAAGLCALIAVGLIGLETSGLIAALRTPNPMLRTAGSPAAAATDLVGRIAGANLFGVAPSTTMGNSDLPETQLQLTLRGVFTAEDQALASAIIETGDGKMQIVKTGGSLGGNTVLQQVYANRVVISRGGLMENLYFPTAAANGIAITTSSTTAASVPTEATPVPAGAGGGGGEEEERKANILRRLEELRARGALSQ